MTKTKKRNVIVALALVALLAIGGTLAYLTATTNTKENTFTMGKGITGITEEPNWKDENGLKFTPGKVIAKDPQIKNTSSTDVDPVYVAATLTYQVSDGNGGWTDVEFAALDNFIDIQKIVTPAKDNVPAVYEDGFNVGTEGETWTLSNDMKKAYYNTTLASQKTTSTIFDAVKIDPLALTEDQVNSAKNFDPEKANEKPILFDMTKYTEQTGSYEIYQMKDFQIIVKGYLVQSEGFDDAQTAMLTAFPEVFGTN